MTQEYTLGFAFDSQKRSVLLINKNRPAWQAGKLNGIGGHIEPGETPIQCMVREFWEETGLRSEEGQWSSLLSFRSSQFVVHTFVLTDDFIYKAKSMTDEAVIITTVSLDYIRDRGISNLPWLIGLALDPDANRITASVTYE